MFDRQITRAAGTIADTSPLCLLRRFVVPSGTKVACRLEQTISSATADEGQQVQLTVTENVKINDQIVIPQGSACVGTIVLATAKRSMGRSGKLDFSIDKVRTADGDMVPLRYTMQKKVRRKQRPKHGCDDGRSSGPVLAGRSVFPDSQRQRHQLSIKELCSKYSPMRSTFSNPARAAAATSPAATASPASIRRDRQRDHQLRHSGCRG